MRKLCRILTSLKSKWSFWHKHVLNDHVFFNKNIENRTACAPKPIRLIFCIRGWNMKRILYTKNQTSLENLTKRLLGPTYRGVVLEENVVLRGKSLQKTFLKKWACLLNISTTTLVTWIIIIPLYVIYIALLYNKRKLRCVKGYEIWHRSIWYIIIYY